VALLLGLQILDSIRNIEAFGDSQLIVQ
jgi:ribonuclease HI